VLIRCEIQDVAVEVDDHTPSNSLEAFESILVRIAGTAVAMYRDTYDLENTQDSSEIVFRPDFDGIDEDDA
jgi:hypothetical protein